MSLLGAFSDGISGMIAFSEAMGSISNNIANTRTVGYKTADTEFSTLLGGNQMSGEETGGVQAYTRSLVSLQGAIEASDNPFDLAINGEGFFIFGDQPVAGGGDITYSRAGNLGPMVNPGNLLTSYLASSTGRYLMAWPADANGNFNLGPASSLVPVAASNQAPFPGVATATAQFVANIPATGDPVSTSIDYYAPQGNPATIEHQQAVLNWTQTAPLTWDLNVNDPDGGLLAGPFNVTFDGDGNLTSVDQLDIGGQFTLDISNVVQRGTLFNRTLYTQDGLGRGEFERLSIESDGTVYGYYTSGAVRPLYRIPVAQFASPDNLMEESLNYYRESLDSGTATLHAPGDDLVRLAPNAVESSTVDLADSFTRMIVTQRAYNSAAQVVKTVDEMTETIRDLKT